MVLRCWPLLILLLSFQLSAESLPYRPNSSDFLIHWERSERMEQSQDDLTASIQTFARHITVGPYQYNIGSLTYLEFPRSLELDIEEMSSSLKMGYDIEHWKYSHSNNLHVWEAVWAKGNRIVRLAILEEQDSYKSVATIYRKGYQEPMAVESYILENALLKRAQRTSWSPKPPSVHSSFFISRAYAQSGMPTGFSGLGTILDSIDPGSLTGSNLPPVTGSSSGGVSLLPGGVGTTSNPFAVTGDVQLNTTFGFDDQTSAQIDVSQAQIDQALSQAETTSAMVDQNWQDTNAQIQNTTDMVNTNWQDTNAQIQNTTDMVDRNWQESNRQAARANRTAEKLSDPKHMFLLSGATAAGAVVGGFVANMAIQGLISGVDWMIEQMTGRRAAQERWRQFQDAQRNWETTLEHALQLERSIDQFLLFHETLQTIRERLPESERSKLSTEEIIRFFNIEILMRQRDIRRLENQFMAESDPRCSVELAEKIAELQNLTQNMSQVVTILGDHRANNPDSDIFDERYFCSQMDNMMRNLLDAESALQRYRLHLINGQAEWQRDLADGVDQLQGVSTRLQTGGDDILDRSVKSARDLYDTNYNALRDRLRRECRAQGMMFTGGCVSEKMRGEASSELQRIEAARDQSIEEARVSAERRLNRPVTVNTDIEYDRIRSYQDWFEELEDQQFCNQRPDDSRCRELSQFRHNGVFYVKNRALDRMDSVCSGRRATLAGVEQAQREAALAANPEATAAEHAGRAPAQVEAESPGFFSRLFGGIGNFFRSIGQFLGLIPKNEPATLGEQSRTQSFETVVATSPEHYHVSDTPRYQPLPTTERAPAQDLRVEETTEITVDAIANQPPELPVDLRVPRELRELPSGSRSPYLSTTRAKGNSDRGLGHCRTGLSRHDRFD